MLCGLAALAQMSRCFFPVRRPPFRLTCSLSINVAGLLLICIWQRRRPQNMGNMRPTPVMAMLVAQAKSAGLAMLNLVRRMRAMTNWRRPPAETPSLSLLGREELVPWAPLPQPQVWVPRRRPPAVARQWALVAAEMLVVRAPPPWPPVLLSRRPPPEVARQRAWLATGERTVVRALPPRPSVLLTRRPAPAVAR